MKRRQIWRVAPGVVVIASFMVLSMFGLDIFRGNLADREVAPLFAVVAAMGLAVMASARPEGKLEIGLKGLVLLATIGAAASSAFQWLANEDAGIWVKLLGGAGTAFAVLVYGARIWAGIFDEEAPG